MSSSQMYAVSYSVGQPMLMSPKAGIAPFALIENLEAKQFMETMRVNSLSCVTISSSLEALG